MPGYKANQYDSEALKEAALKMRQSGEAAVATAFKSNQSSVATHETSQFAQSTADASPVSKQTPQEVEVRNNFGNYITDIVSKNGGEGGSKKEKSREATELRAS